MCKTFSIFLDNSVYNPSSKRAYKRFTLLLYLKQDLVRKQDFVSYSFPVGLSNENHFSSKLFHKKQKERIFFFFLGKKKEKSEN